MWLLALLACAPEAVTVTISGQVDDIPGGGGIGVAQAAVSTTDGLGDPIDAATADAQGRFTANLLPSAPFTLEVQGEDTLPTVFAGLAGLDDLQVPDGFVFTRTAAAIEALRADHAGCPTATAAGAVVEGEARVFINIDPADYDTLPLVTTATVTVTDADGVDHAACYLADDGSADPAATVTGATGRFAVFGLPAGLATVSVVYTVDAEVSDLATFDIHLPADGVAPLYPLFVASP